MNMRFLVVAFCATVSLGQLSASEYYFDEPGTALEFYKQKQRRAKERERKFNRRAVHKKQKTNYSQALQASENPS